MLCRMRHRLRFVALLLLALLCRFGLAEKVPADKWQSGTIREATSSSNSKLTGYVNGRIGGMSTRQITTMTYIVDGTDASYEANWIMRHERAKPLLVTVHGPLRYALVGHDFYVQDNEGKTQKLLFVTKTLKTVSEAK